MPTYHVDLITDRGLQRVPFTLDDDRPLGPQVTYVLEELRQRGIMLRGGPEDELGARWNGRDLDIRRTPQALGLSPLYPVELRMRTRASIAKAEQRTEPAARPFLPKGAYLGPVAGLTGAALAWLWASFLTDLGDLLSSYGAIDLTVAALLGALVGGAICGTTALRRSDSVPAAILIGIVLGAAGAGLGAFLGLFIAGAVGLGNSRQSFIVTRLLVWALTGGLTGLALGMWWFGRDRIRLLDGLLYGTVGGLVGGLLFSLPMGPSDLWQLLGFGIVGAALGAGLTVPGQRRGVGVLELEAVNDRSVGLWKHREWDIRDDGATPLGRRVRVEAVAGRCTISATGPTGDPIVLAGRPLSGPGPLLNQDPLTIGERRYRFRRFPVDGV